MPPKLVLTFRIDEIRCPITEKVFFDPVLLSDGSVYERDEIEEYLLTHEWKNPKTDMVESNIISVHFLSAKIDDLAQNHPEIIHEIYFAKHRMVKYIRNSYIKGVMELLQRDGRFKSALFEEAGGHTFIHLLCCVGTADVMENLASELEIAFDKSFLELLLTPESIDKDTGAQWLPIHTAISRNNDKEAVDWIINYCFNRNSQQSEQLWNQLGLSFSSDSVPQPVHTMLLDLCNNPSQETEYLIPVLVKLGASLAYTTPEGNTPLMCATSNGSLGIVQKLVELGADINAAGVKGWTPLMSACSKDHQRIVEYLLELPKLDVDAVDEDGETALTISAKLDNDETAKMLVRKNANCLIKNKYGDTLFEMMDVSDEMKKIVAQAMEEMKRIQYASQLESQQKELEGVLWIIGTYKTKLSEKGMKNWRKKFAN